MTAEPNFEPYDQSRKYVGTMFLGDNKERYASDCIELAIGRDSVPAFDECIAAGYVDQNCRTIFNDSVIGRCEHKGAKRIAKHLRELGWPE